MNTASINTQEVQIDRTLMPRTITVRAWNGIKENVIVDKTDTLDDFVGKFSRLVGLDSDKSVKLIYKGKIISSDNFNSIENGGICLGILTNNTTPAADSKKAIVESPESIIEDPGNSENAEDSEDIEDIEDVEDAGDTFSRVPARSMNMAETTDTDPKYSYAQIKASLVVFLDFVRTNPQVRNLFLTDYTQLVREIMQNRDLDHIVRNILSQSGQIMEAMQKGVNIKVNINGETGDVDEITLTAKDEAEISDMILMGFDPTLVIKTYVESGNDRDIALGKLLAM